MNNSQEAKETYSMGSRFEAFLEEEGILAQVEEVAIKRNEIHHFVKYRADTQVCPYEIPYISSL
ncbi:MAG: hypothetical protein DRQ49_19065 [Gammaproteobacteria bacterium]|nr:MAG: hypothetical protein DRQ49_19065 [Gammaproteobacteria bacterium]RKZ38382.1 MAG: hypothetical protein DRQ41_12150 [Gammaproteobacteria bacterium]RKZ72721.1 MAG: hypothetical protein DRQ57_16545 [Gammaproteobacteria bacterium]